MVASGKAERYLVQIGAYSTTLNAKRAQDKANAAGFKTIEIVATLPGVPLYASFHFESVERFEIALPNGATMPVERMRKNDGPSP